MSVLAQAYSYITGLFTPVTASETATSDPQTFTGIRKPIEGGESYFPDTASRRSSLSSVSIESQEPRPESLVRQHTGLNPLDPLSRDFSKPAQEIDVAKQLALEPRKHSLHHSLKRAAANERVFVAEDTDTKAKKLAAAKAELLALAGKV